VVAGDKRGGGKEARSARRLDAVTRRSSAGVCGLVLPAVEVVVLVVGSLLSLSLFLWCRSVGGGWRWVGCHVRGWVVALS